MKETIIINEKDNVAVTLNGTGEIPAGHKFAIKDVKKGEYVIKYGEIIGRAKTDIKKGDWVHFYPKKDPRYELTLMQINEKQRGEVENYCRAENITYVVKEV